MKKIGIPAELLDGDYTKALLQSCWEFMFKNLKFTLDYYFLQLVPLA